eukprot:1475626-Rhodomonas_salina.1
MPHQDRGKRGMGPLLQSGELEEMVRSVREAQSVAILTGYPCCLHDPPTETDGPLGAIAMARAISALGIRTVILTDECNEAPVSAALKASLRAYPPSSPSRQACVVKAFPGGDVDAKKIVATYELDYVIAIERPGPAEDGGYYTMKGRDMSQSVGIAKLEQLLDLRVDSVSTYACGKSGTRWLKSAGIGDGGNELGMGKRRALVSEHVQLGAKIGCVTEHARGQRVQRPPGLSVLSELGVCETRVRHSNHALLLPNSPSFSPTSAHQTDHLVAAGVSNWGGWAVCFALYALIKKFVPSDHNETMAFLAADTDLKQVLPTCEGELAVLEAMVAAGA